MTNKRNDDSEDDRLEHLADSAGVELRRAEVDVDLGVTERLAQARRAAVTQTEAGSNVFTKPLMMFSGFAAACAATLVVVVLFRSPIEQLPVSEDLDLAVAQEVELLEDLEFVAWMVALEDEENSPTSG